MGGKLVEEGTLLSLLLLTLGKLEFEVCGSFLPLTLGHRASVLKAVNYVGNLEKMVNFFLKAKFRINFRLKLKITSCLWSQLAYIKQGSFIFT